MKLQVKGNENSAISYCLLKTNTILLFRHGQYVLQLGT